MAFLAHAFTLLATYDFKIRFLYAFKKSRNFFGETKKAREIRIAIAETEDFSL